MKTFLPKLFFVTLFATSSISFCQDPTESSKLIELLKPTSEPFPTLFAVAFDKSKLPKDSINLDPPRAKVARIRFEDSLAWVLAPEMMPNASAEYKFYARGIDSRDGISCTWTVSFLKFACVQTVDALTLVVESVPPQGNSPIQLWTKCLRRDETLLSTKLKPVQVSIFGAYLEHLIDIRSTPVSEVGNDSLYMLGQEPLAKYIQDNIDNNKDPELISTANSLLENDLAWYRHIWLVQTPIKTGMGFIKRKAATAIASPSDGARNVDWF